MWNNLVAANLWHLRCTVSAQNDDSISLFLLFLFIFPQRMILERQEICEIQRDGKNFRDRKVLSHVPWGGVLVLGCWEYLNLVLYISIERSLKNCRKKMYYKFHLWFFNAVFSFNRRFYFHFFKLQALTAVWSLRMKQILSHSINKACYLEK